MSDKIKKTGKSYDDEERYSRRDDDNEDDFDGGGRNSNRGGDNGSKYEKLYGVIDAFIDQVDMPRNRNRALKYGIRALGELLSETNAGRGGGSRGSQGGGSVSKSSKK